MTSNQNTDVRYGCQAIPYLSQNLHIEAARFHWKPQLTTQTSLEAEGRKKPSLIHEFTQAYLWSYQSSRFQATIHCSGCHNTYLQFNNMSRFAHYYYSWPRNSFQLVWRPESRQTSLSSWSLNQTLGPALASSMRKLSLS